MQLDARFLIYWKVSLFVYTCVTFNSYALQFLKSINFLLVFPSCSLSSIVDFFQGNPEYIQLQYV